MVDTSKNDIFFNRQYIEAYSSNIMAKGFTLTKQFPTQAITQGTVINYTRDEKADGKILSALNKNARPISEGAKLTEVRGNLKTGKATDLVLRGFQYTITPELEQNPGFNLEDEVRDMSFTLAQIVETDVAKTLLANAKAPSATGVHKWTADATTLKEIQSDIIDMQSAYDETDYAEELNGIFYNKAQYNALRKDMNYSVEKYELPTDGYISANRNPIDFVDSIHQKSKYLPAGTSLGWDLSNPPATMYYGVQANTYTPQTYAGLEPYAPLMRAFVKEEDGVTPTKTIQLAVAYGLVVNKPAVIQKQTGL